MKLYENIPPSRQGDADRSAEYEEDDWNPEVNAKASTLSRDNSGRGSIRWEPETALQSQISTSHFQASRAYQGSLAEVQLRREESG